MISRLRTLLILATLGCLAGSQIGWETHINGSGAGQASILVWCHPRRPPAQPTQTFFNPNSPNGTIAQAEGCNSASIVRCIGQQVWRQQITFRSAGGDTVDWHSMLPFVTPVSPDAAGTMSLSAVVTGPHSATFTLDWSGTDEGVAMHIGWFETLSNGTEVLLHEEGPRVGPWTEHKLISITSTGPIGAVDVESSGAAVSTSCNTADFNCDGDLGTDADIAAFFACLSGSCPPPPCASTADFNGDGDVGTDEDIASFFSVLGGGTC